MEKPGRLFIRRGRVPEAVRRGRGARSNLSGRFETLAKTPFDDGWQSLEDLPRFKTQVTDEAAKKIITRNQSPDISFDRSINPYRGCEHGCSYCFARPTHAYMGLSPGLDFESKLFAKSNAAELLEKELADPSYVPQTIAMGTNTDPYQPIERQHRITRQVLEVLQRFNHPVGIVTKSALVARDLDILGPMAEKGLVKVALSVTTLDPKLARAMEPRASTPEKRLQALRLLSSAGVPSAVMFAPIIPALNDAEMEDVLKAASQAGAKEAGYVSVAPAARGARPVPRMADVGSARPGGTCSLADALHARRQGLRRHLGPAHARHRTLCLVDRPAVRDRGQAIGAERGEMQTHHQGVHPRPRSRHAVGSVLAVMTAKAGMTLVETD